MIEVRYDVVMDRYFTNNTAGGEMNDMIREESHYGVRWELSGGGISLIVGPTWWLLN